MNSNNGTWLDHQRQLYIHPNGSTYILELVQTNYMLLSMLVSTSSEETCSQHRTFLNDTCKGSQPFYIGQTRLRPLQALPYHEGDFKPQTRAANLSRELLAADIESRVLILFATSLTSATCSSFSSPMKTAQIQNSRVLNKTIQSHHLFKLLERSKVQNLTSNCTSPRQPLLTIVKQCLLHKSLRARAFLLIINSPHDLVCRQRISDTFSGAIILTGQVYSELLVEKASLGFYLGKALDDKGPSVQIEVLMKPRQTKATSAPTSAHLHPSPIILQATPDLVKITTG